MRSKGKWEGGGVLRVARTDSEPTTPGQNVGALSGEPLWIEPPDHLPLNPRRLLGQGLLRTGTRPSLNTRDSVTSQTQLLFLSPRTPGVCHLEREADQPPLRGFPQPQGKKRLASGNNDSQEAARPQAGTLWGRPHSNKTCPPQRSYKAVSSL